MPTFEECQSLHLTRSELAHLSIYDNALIGCFVLLRHRSGDRPITSLVEIAGLVDLGYESYDIKVSGKSVKTSLGVLLVMRDGTITMRSLVNVLSRPIDRADYDKWLAVRAVGSAYSMRGNTIRMRSEMIETLKNKSTV